MGDAIPMVDRAQEIVDRLSRIKAGDQESDHWDADKALLEYLKTGSESDKAIAQAWEDLNKRSGGFWHA